ncbi:reverse transcriptase [Cucumis melo var. makuwa]|uniref:Reverse transcriptase n=1 Tax=Cucumis melo var. makuwa TaxID=1194695 RepID=A0A5D3DL80_CUCMM|nr:reverse transcriptase [Cucumis melo var. makuwa]TYK24100.1 reverse transcriptase [Cucumis melo var. makuwa]
MPSHVLHLHTPLECLKESYPSICLIFYVPLWVFECTAYVRNHVPIPTILLHGESENEESNSNGVISLESSSPTLVTIPSPGPHYTPAPIQDSESLRDQGMTGSIDSHIDNKRSENDRSETTILKKKSTKSSTKHSIANYVSYENLSPLFRAFTASLDSIVILTSIHTALECHE